MKYALVNDEPQEAKPGRSGRCICCDGLVIAKCGDVRVPHWAHSGKRMCDLWWENETEWHRAWKDRFPKEWQEVIHFAENNEKHIADVKTDKGCVIEFQYSHIKPEERQAREYFYNRMIWVVNGTRRSKDREKFIDVWEHSHPLDGKVEVRRLRDYFDQSALLRDWGGSKAPIFFDFNEDILWGLLPKTIEKRAYAFKIWRNDLLAYLLPASQVSFDALLKRLIDFIIAKETLAAVQQNSQPKKINHSVRPGRHRL